MITGLILLFMAALLTGSALHHRTTFLRLVFLTCAFPISVLSSSSGLLAFSGGMTGEAAYLLLIFLISLMLCLVDPGALLRSFRTLLPLYIFLLYSFLSIAWSDDKIFGLRLSIKLLAPLVFFAVCVSALRTLHDLHQVEKAIIWGSLILLSLALVNTLTGGALDSPVGRLKWANSGVLVAPYKSPANFSFLLCTTAFLCLSKHLKTKNRLYLIGYALFSLSTLACFTRISMAALVFGSFLITAYFTKSFIYRYVMPLVLLFLSLLSIFLIEPLRQRMFFHGKTQALETDNWQNILESVNTSGRTQLWEQALRYFESTNYSIWGAGSGSVDAWLRQYSDAAALHSEYLRLFIDYGFIGLALFSVAIVLLLRNINKAGRDSSKETVCYRSFSTATLSLYLLSMLTDNTLNYVSDIGFQLFFGIAAYNLLANRTKVFVKDCKTRERGGKNKILFNLA